MTDNECRKLLKNRLISYRKTLKLPKEVTFGVEIEYENIVKDTVSYLLDDETYFNPKFKGWVNKTEIDLSEYNKLNEEMNGEVNSPILIDNITAWKNLKTALEILNKNGAVITQRCGGHVNIGTHILGDNAEYWRNFLLLWLLYEKEIYKFSKGEYSDIRRDEQSLFYKISSELLIENLIDTNKDSYLLSLPYCLYDKFHDVYINRFIKDDIIDGNRIEFRIPNGSLKEEIWQNYINFFTKLMLASKKELDIEEVIYKIKNKEHSAIDLANYIFEDETDKENFLIQTLKTNKIYKKELPEHLTY